MCVAAVVLENLATQLTASSRAPSGRWGGNGRGDLHRSPRDLRGTETVLRYDFRRFRAFLDDGTAPRPGLTRSSVMLLGGAARRSSRGWRGWRRGGRGHAERVRASSAGDDGATASSHWAARTMEVSDKVHRGGGAEETHSEARQMLPQEQSAWAGQCTRWHGLDGRGKVQCNAGGENTYRRYTRCKRPARERAEGGKGGEGSIAVMRCVRSMDARYRSDGTLTAMTLLYQAGESVQAVASENMLMPPELHWERHWSQRQLTRPLPSRISSGVVSSMVEA